MFQFMPYADYLQILAHQNTNSRMTDEQFVVTEINRFRMSKRYKDMTDGDRYYRGQHDILYKQRTAIGDDGSLITLDNLPNNRIVDNQYKKMVDQKTNYIVGQPFVLQSDNQQYINALDPYLQTRVFFNTLKSVVKDAINCGIGWLYPYYAKDGKLAFKRFRPFEVIPEWSDADHTELESAIRFYEVVEYEGTKEKVVTKVEVYNADGVYYFDLNNGNLIPSEPFYAPYITVTEYNGAVTTYNWTNIPLIPFKYNQEEIPLIAMCKSMQDGLNAIESNWQDQMQEDPRNTIMVIVNYDGQDLGEFRRNLATFGAVKVRTEDGAAGDVKTLQVQVNSENYKAIIEQFKKSIIENCMGYDAKDDRLGSNANEMNIKSMYSDIELDANGLETELQAAFEKLLWFVKCDLANNGGGNFLDADVDIIFNRDIMVNESAVINDCKASSGIISDETIIANHPWVDDPAEEMKRLEKQKEENMNLYGDFGQQVPVNNAPEDDTDE